MQNFEEFYKALKEYKSEFGNCNVPTQYVARDGYRLGKKVKYVRSRQKENRIYDNEIAMLNEIGFEWSISSGERVKGKTIPIDKVIELYKEYIMKNNSSNVHYTYVTEQGINLGIILRNIRNESRKITDEERIIFENMGLKFTKKTTNRKNRTFSINQIIELIRDYKNEFGNCDISQSYVTKDGIKLGSFARTIKRRNRIITDKQREELQAIGFSFIIKEKKRLKTKDVICLISEYKEKYGNCNIPPYYKTEDGFCLGQICLRIKNGRRKMTDEERDELTRIGFIW